MYFLFKRISIAILIFSLQFGVLNISDEIYFILRCNMVIFVKDAESHGP